jgi:S1-C subfamily serine protease
VLTNDGTSYQATVLTRDPVNDLAIVKVDIQDAPTLSLADSAQLEIGQRVIAIGNSLGQYQNTVTTGVVSGIGRSIVAGGTEGGVEALEGVIQTDAAINPGNSGGPLLNSLGQVIGINTAVDREGQLVGFAIPSNDAQKALDSFRKTGRITRPFLGIRYVMITPALAEQEHLPKDYGALIIRGQSAADVPVVPGSAADKAGLKENDIILEVNGQKVEQSATLSKFLKQFQPGDVVRLKVHSQGQERDVNVTLGENN